MLQAFAEDYHERDGMPAQRRSSTDTLQLRARIPVRWLMPEVPAIR